MARQKKKWFMLHGIWLIKKITSKQDIKLVAEHTSTYDNNFQRIMQFT